MFSLLQSLILLFYEIMSCDEKGIESCPPVPKKPNFHRFWENIGRLLGLIETVIAWLHVSPVGQQYAYQLSRRARSDNFSVIFTWIESKLTSSS